jgi:hypothetical protein
MKYSSQMERYERHKDSGLATNKEKNLIKKQ